MRIEEELAMNSGVDDLVGEALGALRQVQPHGPYLLMDECIGVNWPMKRRGDW